MDQLKNILENINLKNFDEALNQCNKYEQESNKNHHIISNFRGVIYFLKKDLNLAEINFIKSHKLNNNLKIQSKICF